MDSQNPLLDRSSGGRDMLNFTPTATPSADAWIATFTRDFIAHPDATHATHALMSGLRFYTPAFVAEIAALPPVEARLPPLPGRVARSIYTATGPLIVEVYEKLIRRNASRQAIQAAFEQGMPQLLAQYNSTSATDHGMGY